MSDYANRTVDVLLLQPADNSLRRELKIFGDTASGMICTGIEKLVQRWTIEFLTIRGSMGWHLSGRGSDFMQQLRAGYLKTVADVRSAYLAAAAQVWQNLNAEDTGSEPADERLLSSSLRDVTLLQGSVRLDITLQSQAGTSYTLILPVPTTPEDFVTTSGI